jgi:hypothetical protein
MHLRPAPGTQRENTPCAWRLAVLLPFTFAIAALGKGGMKVNGKDGAMSVAVHQHLQPVSA